MNSRRHFLRKILVGTPLLVGVKALAQDAPAPAPVPENDPVAMALGYKIDATTVDATKYPQHKPGQFCDGCALYTGKPGEAQGPCTIFQNRLVAAKGWCATFAPKPAPTE